MKNLKKKKYDIIIILSLIAAMGCIVLATIEYLNSSSNTTNNLFSEVKEALKEMRPADTTEEEYEEPENIEDVDKEAIINSKLTNIVKGREVNDILTKNILDTWQGYEVTNVEYIRKIAKYYYAYKVYIKVNNIDATLPVHKDDELSTDEYLVFSINFNITYSKRDNGYIVKLIEIPNN